MSRRRDYYQSLRRRASGLLRPHKTIAKGGLLYIASWIASSDLTEEAYLDWHDNDFVPRLLTKAGITFVVRCKNTHPNAAGGTGAIGDRAVHGGPFLSLVRVDDVNWLSSDAFRKSLRDVTEGDILGTEVRGYELIQRYQGKGREGVASKCIVAVSIEPAEGQEDDVDAWYRKEHLDALASNPIFLRATRYKLSPGVLDSAAKDQVPMYLALHEYESVDGLLKRAIEHGSLVDETEWTKRILGNATKVERTIWQIASAKGVEDSRL